MRRAIGVVTVLAFAGLSQTAAAQTAPLTLHLKYRVVSNLRSVIDAGSGGLVGSGRYVGYLRPSLHPLGEQLVLIDDKTGRRIVAKWPTYRIGRYLAVCDATLGGTWVGFDCGAGSGTSPRFYNLQTRKWRRVACDSTCQGLYNPHLIAVGARWFVLTGAPHEPCGDNVHFSCGPTTYLYYNIATGQQGFPKVDAHTIIDLDSPTLTREVCPPLQVPLQPGLDTTTWFPPPLTFYGSFAVAWTSTGLYLEQCGSGREIPPAGPGYTWMYFGGSQAVAFGNSNPVSGIFLPSLRRFTFNVPLGSSHGVLGPRHLYVITPNHVWVAAFPSKPPASS